MPSEKNRYLKRNRGPVREYDMDDFLKRLPSLGTDRLVQLLAVRTESDKILNNTLSVALAFQEPLGDISFIKNVLDYALHVPDSTFYTEDAYEIILDELLLQIEELTKKGNTHLARQAAEYAIIKGNEMLEKFEEGYAWGCSLERIEKWLADCGQK